MIDIASRGSLIKWVIASTALLGLALTAVGCGGGEEKTTHAVEWGVFRQVSPRQVVLVASVDYCDGDPRPTIERPRVEYAGKRAVIELILASKEGSDGGGCLLIKAGIFKRITLRSDLDELVLLDASTSPPARRWPG